MPYAAGIAVAAGSNEIFEDITPCFTSTIANIRKLDGQWILESSMFGACDSHEKVYASAMGLLSTIHSVLALYMGVSGEPFSIGSTMKLTDDEQLIDRRIYGGLLTVNTVRPAHEVLPSTASGSLATDLLSRVAADPAMAAALSLVGHFAKTDWPQVYDIIEFFGGVRGIEKSGFAPRSEVRRVRQTANHYRHLGSPTAYPLPSNPPTLSEAGRFVKDIMKRWIATRL
jgi:hypothetical protein